MSTLKTDVIKDVAETVAINVTDIGSVVSLPQDLANESDPTKGSRMVAWFSSLTGAVSRWVSEKLADQLSFKDFGIVGDGSNETAKLQAAFAASAGKLLKAEPGKTYFVTDELLIPSNATVDFCGSTLRYTINVDGKSCLRFKNVNNSELRNVVIEPVGTMVVAPHTGDSRMPVVVGEYIGHPANHVCQNIRISGVKVIGGFPAMNAIAVFGQSENIIIENPVIEGTSEPASAGIGILVHWSPDNYDAPTKTYHPRNVKIVNPRFRKCALGATAEQASCIFLSGAFNVRVENIDAYDVNTGFYVYPGDYAFTYAADLAASQVSGIVIEGGVIVGSRKYGVNILGQADGVGPILPMGVRINGLRTDGVDAAIRVRRSDAGVVIDGSSPHHATVGILVSESADVTAVNCDVTYNARQGVYFTSSSRCVLASSRISFNNTEGLGNQLGSAVYLDGACSGNFVIGNAIGDEAATEYYGVRINGSTVKHTTVSDNVFGNFTTNVAIQNDANPYAAMTSGSGNVFAGSSLLAIAATPPMVSYDSGGSATVRANAAPTTGTWKRGDRFINSVPTVGQPKAWVCTVGGTPGTWVSEGVL